MALDRSLCVGARKVAVTDDRVRETHAVGLLLKPFGLRDRVIDADRGLDMDGLRDVLKAGLGRVLIRRIEQHLQPVDIAEDRMDPVWLQPDIAQLGILQVPVMDVGVHKR